MRSNLFFGAACLLLAGSLYVGVHHFEGRALGVLEDQHGYYQRLMQETLTPEVPPQLPGAAYGLRPLVDAKQLPAEVFRFFDFEERKGQPPSKIPVLDRLMRVAGTTRLAALPDDLAFSRLAGLVAHEGLWVAAPRTPDLPFAVYGEQGDFRYFVGQVGDGPEQYLHYEVTRVRMFGSYLLIADWFRKGTKFLLYQLGPDQAQLVRVFHLDAVVEDLIGQDAFLERVNMEELGAGDFAFRFDGSRLDLYLFHLDLVNHETAKLHLYVTSEEQERHAGLALVRPFGEATVAERMRPIVSRFPSLMVGDQLWALREFDHQIDVFDLQGNLVRTLALAEMTPQIFGGRAIGNSADLTATMLAARNPEDKPYVDRFRMGGLYRCGDVVLAVRFNDGHRYAQVAQVFDLEGRSVLDHAVVDQFMFLDGGHQAAFLMDHFWNEEGALGRPWPEYRGLDEHLQHVSPTSDGFRVMQTQLDLLLQH